MVRLRDKCGCVQNDYGAWKLCLYHEQREGFVSVPGEAVSSSLQAKPDLTIDWPKIYNLAWLEMKKKVDDLHDLLDELHIEIVYAMAEEE